MFFIKFLVFAIFATQTYGLTCFCDNHQCKLPTCCKSGELTYDACGCCKVCAKGKGEVCGGPWNMAGRCASELTCLKQFLEGERELDFFNKNGICVEMDVKDTPPGAPHEFIDGRKGGTCIKRCQQFEQNNSSITCHCATKPSSFNLPGENCTEEESEEVATKGWCFLENVKLYSNTSDYCFGDITFSERWGRFYSFQACQNFNQTNYPSLDKDELPPFVTKSLGNY